MSFKNYQKSHYKLDYYYCKGVRGSKLRRIKRALKKKAQREQFKDLNK